MTKEVYFSMQHSESVVATMSATIFAAFVSRGEVTEDNEDVLVKKCVDVAIKLATRADKMVKSDEEWTRQDGGAGVVL